MHNVGEGAVRITADKGQVTDSQESGGGAGRTHNVPDDFFVYELSHNFVGSFAMRGGLTVEGGIVVDLLSSEPMIVSAEVVGYGGMSEGPRYKSRGRQLLDEIQRCKETGEWRTDKLKDSTLAMAYRVLDAFEDSVAEGVAFDTGRLFNATWPQPRVSPTDDGGIVFEWESGDRELIVQVEPDDSVSAARFVREVGEGEFVGLDGISGHARWVVFGDGK